jgi:hypothetical protein
MIFHVGEYDFAADKIESVGEVTGDGEYYVYGISGKVYNMNKRDCTREDFITTWRYQYKGTIILETE